MHHYVMAVDLYIFHMYLYTFLQTPKLCHAHIGSRVEGTVTLFTLAPLRNQSHPSSFSVLFPDLNFKSHTTCDRKCSRVIIKLEIETLHLLPSHIHRQESCSTVLQHPMTTL